MGLWPLKKENVRGKYTQVITYRGHSNERIDISFKYAMSFHERNFHQKKTIKL